MYSQKLIDAVKRVFPNDRKINALAADGSIILGRYLDDSAGIAIHIDTILKAETLSELKSKALELKEKIELYKMWCEEDPRKKM